MASLADLLAAAQTATPGLVGQVLPSAGPGAPPSPLEGLLRTGLSGQPLTLPDVTGIGGGLGRLLGQGAPQAGFGGGFGLPPAPGGGFSFGDGTGGPTPYSGPTSFQPVRTGHMPIIDRQPEPIPSGREVAPEIQRVYYELWSRWPESSNLGTHVVKYIRGDPANGLSEHSFGDAIDIGGPDEQLTEQASWLANHAGKLGVTEVIFKDAIWTDDEGWHPYTSGGHDTHIHVTGPQTYGDTSPSFPLIDWNPPRPSRPSRPTGPTGPTGPQPSPPSPSDVRTPTPTRTRGRRRRPASYHGRI